MSRLLLRSNLISVDGAPANDIQVKHVFCLSSLPLTAHFSHVPCMNCEGLDLIREQMRRNFLLGEIQVIHSRPMPCHIQDLYPYSIAPVVQWTSSLP